MYPRIFQGIYTGGELTYRGLATRGVVEAVTHSIGDVVGKVKEILIKNSKQKKQKVS